ncbi:MAG: hypothetical protein ACYTGP_09270 [Planctomycetota bacterium]|jgi:hypothetical protein
MRKLHRAALAAPARVAQKQQEIQARQREVLERLRDAHEAPPGLSEEERLRWTRDRSQEVLDEHRALVTEQMQLQFRARRDLQEQAIRLDRLNRQLFHELPAVLPDDAMEVVRQRYLYTPYGDLPRDRGPAMKHFERALGLEDLTDDQRERLLARRAAYRAAADAVAEQMLDVVAKYFAVSDPFRPDDESAERQAYESKMERHGETRRGLNAAAIESIAAILGADHAEAVAGWTERFEEGPTKLTTITVMFMPGFGGARGGEGAVAVQTHEMPIGPSAGMLVTGREHLPDAITRGDLDAWAPYLGLDEMQTVIVETLHDDYLARVDETTGADRAELAETIPTMWGRGGAEAIAPDVASIKHVYALRSRVVEAIAAADARFLDDVAVALYEGKTPEKLANVVVRRRRALYSRAGADEGAMGHSIINGTLRTVANRGGRKGAAEIDLWDLADELEPDAATMASIEPTLTSYEERAAELARRRYEASMRFQVAVEQLVAKLLREGATRTSTPLEASDPFVAARDGDGAVARDAREQLSTLNDETLAALRETLPADAAERLRRAWNRARFPNVYHERHSAMPTLTRALELPDLTDEQRERLRDLAAEFRAEHEAINEQLVVLREGGSVGFEPNATPDEMQERAKQRRQRFDRIRALGLERTELRDKTLARVRRLLDEAQNEALEKQAEPESP